MLDAILVVLIIVFAISGYRQGFIVGVLSFVGFIGGGVLAALGAPPVIQAFVPNPTQQALIAIAMVFLFAALGQFFTSYLGALIRNRVTWNSARVVDAMGGALVSVLSVLLVSWLMGSAVANSVIPLVANQVQNSRCCGPWTGSCLIRADVVFHLPQDRRPERFPAGLQRVGHQRTGGGRGTRPAVLNTEELQRASQSVVKVLGNAPSCQRRVEGTGFVYAHERVMTNAHVVAGVEEELRSSPGTVPSTRRRGALRPPTGPRGAVVPGLDLEPLEFEMQAKKGDDAVVAGFPRDSGFTVVPARIRAEQTARGPDFYHSQQVSREIYQVRAVIQPGNSGGPLLSPRGTVYGVVFAAATNDEETGYVLTAEEVAANAEAGIHATEPVSTQECD